MNQKFTVSVEVEFDLWPTKDNVKRGDVEACAKARLAGILESAGVKWIAVKNASVINEVPISLTTPVAS